MSKPFVVDELEKKARLYAERNKTYGSNYLRFGAIMKALIGETALVVSSEHDYNRLGVFVHIVTKLSRYAENWHRGGHDDSLDDISVYAMMLKELDQVKHIPDEEAINLDGIEIPEIPKARVKEAITAGRCPACGAAGQLCTLEEVGRSDLRVMCCALPPPFRRR